MTECRHLLQQVDAEGRFWCLVCEDEVPAGPITPYPGALPNIADDPLLDFMVNEQ